MKSLRTLFILLSITALAGASWAAQSAPVIQAFYHHTTGWLTANDALEVVLEGTADGAASFEIPGVQGPIRMEWDSDQRYRGYWYVPETARNLQGAQVVGELKVGSVSLYARSLLPVNIDTIPPYIGGLWPEPDSVFTQTRPSISAVLDDSTGSGVAPKMVTLTVDDVDVTAQATVSPSFVSYRPTSPLGPGVRMVTLALEDKAGNAASKSWSFTIGDESVAIKSIQYSTSPTVGPGDVISVRMEGASGGKGSFRFVVPGVNAIGEQPLSETSPGVYEGTYKVRQGGDLRDARLVGCLTTSSGTVCSAQADKVLVGRPVLLAQPRITSPKSNSRVPSPFVISGTTVPAGRVRLVLTATTVGLGKKWMDGIVADQIVTADDRGVFQSAPVTPGELLPRKNVEYTIRATALGLGGSESKPKVVRFKWK